MSISLYFMIRIEVIIPDKKGYPHNVFLYSKFSLLRPSMGLAEALLMCTHNICSCGEIRKNIYRTPSLI